MTSSGVCIYSGQVLQVHLGFVPPPLPSLSSFFELFVKIYNKWIINIKEDSGALVCDCYKVKVNVLGWCWHRIHGILNWSPHLKAFFNYIWMNISLTYIYQMSHFHITYNLRHSYIYLGEVSYLTLYLRQKQHVEKYAVYRMQLVLNDMLLEGFGKVVLIAVH